MKTRTAIAAGAGIVIAAGALFAGCARYTWHNMPVEKKVDKIVSRAAWKLDLDAEQKTKFKAMATEIALKIDAKKADRAKDFEKARELLTRDAITAGDLEAITSTREADFREIKPLVIEKLVQFHAMLKPEQKKKLAEMMNRHQRWHQ